MKKKSIILSNLILFITLITAIMIAGCQNQNSKLPLLETEVFPILEGTHKEAGFFSLCEAHNGKIYIGTELAGKNSFLVEFDPKTEKQRAVINTSELCDAAGDGVTAQGKIHTINYVAPSGIVYIASKQGGMNKGQNPFWYPGGYLMTYNPKTDEAKCLGKVPIPGHGIIDVTADEQRGLIYIVTCDDGASDYKRGPAQDRQLWMVFNMKTKQFKVLGPHLCRYGTTLVGPDGRAFALTSNFDLAVYEPDIDRVSVWPTYIGEKKFDPLNYPGENLPTWVGADNNTKAFFMMLSDPMLYEIDLTNVAPKVAVTKRKKLINTSKLTAQLASLKIGPDGKVYNMIKDNMQTGVYHLVRYNRTEDKIEDLGIVDIPLRRRGHADLRNQGMTICKDGTIYATFISPFELRRFKTVKAIDDN